MIFYTNHLDEKVRKEYNYPEVISVNFTDYPEVTLAFSQSDEKDINISYIGFNNFEFIKPIKYFRVQHFYTLHIILEGSGTVMIEGNTYNATKGDMFFIPPDVKLCYFPDDKDKWKYAWFEFSGENAMLYGEKMGFSGDNYLKPCINFENTFLQFGRIFKSILNNIPVGYYDVLSLFFKILDSNIKKSEKLNLAESVVAYINCNYSNADMTLPGICEHFNISHSYLCKIFKNSYSHSVKSYITKVRINEACRLLETTDVGIQEIAYSVGFSDSIHFMKTFKKCTKKTPTNYRKDFIL